MARYRIPSVQARLAVGLLVLGTLVPGSSGGSDGPPSSGSPRPGSAASDSGYRMALEHAIDRYGDAESIPAASRAWLARRFGIPEVRIDSDLREVACRIGTSDEPVSVIFTETCQGCHARTGTGDPEMAEVFGVPVTNMDLTSERSRRRTDAELRAILVAGRHEMPPYGGALDAIRVRDLIAYLRRLQASCSTTGPPAGPGSGPGPGPGPGSAP